MTLEMLQEEIKGCRLCSLCEGMPFSPVPGIGPHNANVMLVGEAPGEDESVAEEPFIGLAGRMLNRILNLANLQRKDVYICNTVNCRPTKGNKNRPPSKKEISTCSTWLYKQIELVKPKVIFTLGMVSTSILLKPKYNMKLGDYLGIVTKIDKPIQVDVIANYHPSYLMQYGKNEIQKSVDILKMWENYK